MLKKWIEKITGIDKIKAELAAEMQAAKQQTDESIQIALSAKQEEEAAIKAEQLAKSSPKEIATAKKEPYVAVLDTKINEDNPRNGFFELDWNEYFITQLRDAGYYGDTEEELVDRWFQDLCKNIGAEADINMDRRGAGYINFNKLGDGKSEVY